MKKLLLLLTLISRFAFGQGSISTEYNSTTKKSYLKTGVFPKANVITYTDTSVNKSPVWWFNTGRIKFKNSIVAIDTADFDGILVSKGDSLLLADKNLMVIGVTNGLTLSSGFAKIGGTLTDSTVIDMNNRSLVFKTNSADVNKEVIKITDESDNIALIVNQSGKNVIALGKNAGSGTISAEDCNFLGENAGSGATNALFSNFMGKNAGLNSTTATHSNFFGQGAGSSAPLAGSSNFLGANAGAGATNAGNSNFLGQSAGNNAVNANGSNFLGYESGNGASNANGSNFLGNFSGSNSTNANNSNFFGFVSGRNATNAYFSNFIGPGSGDAAINANNSNFFGAYTGLNSTNASNSNFFGKYAGRNAINAANSIFIGTETGDSSVNLANSIVIGKYSGRKETLNTTTGGTSIQIGNYTHTGGFNNTIAIGDSATNTKTNQVVFAPKYRHLRLRGVDYELPSSQGGVDTYLKNDGSGVLSWATVSGGGTTTNALTFNNSGSGDASGTTFNGSAARTISYNSLGAAPLASPTFTGTVTIPSGAVMNTPASIGLANGTGLPLATGVTGILTGTNGGTGVNNGAKTITVSGNTSIGSSTNTVTLATTGNTSVTLPTTGTLATTTDLASYLPLIGAAYSTTTGNGLAITANSLTSGNAINLSSSSTAATSNTNTILNIASTGANASGSQTTYGQRISNTKTGTASTNIAMQLDASGGTNNYGLLVNTGNVGIGTASPLSLLHVSDGNTLAASLSSQVPANAISFSQNTSSMIRLLSSSNTAATGAIVLSMKSRGTVTSPLALATDDVIGGSLFGGHDGTAVNYGASIYTFCDGTPTTGETPMRLSFTTGGSVVSRAERIRITSSGLVGIGTTTPQSKLDVEGSVAIGATYSGTTAAPANGLLVEGNVGIGTTSPTAKLHIAGTVVIQSYTVSTLPTCASGVYQRATVTDALTPVYDANVVGGGARVIEVLCNGTNWVCH